MTVYAITDTKKGEQGLRLLTTYLQTTRDRVSVGIGVTVRMP